MRAHACVYVCAGWKSWAQRKEGRAIWKVAGSEEKMRDEMQEKARDEGKMRYNRAAK